MDLIRTTKCNNSGSRICNIFFTGKIVTDVHNALHVDLTMSDVSRSIMATVGLHEASMSFPFTTCSSARYTGL
jgi:hypothetical protein